MSRGWIAVDLDGTLAHYESFGDGSVGAPIKPMVRRIRHYLKQGKDVRIFTARVAHKFGHEIDGEATTRIQDWCKAHLGQILPVTCSKDYNMYLLLDDRAESVIPNTGILVREELRRAVEALTNIATGAPHAYIVAQETLDSLDSWSKALAGKE
jgi:hypothetical protein